MTMDGAYTSVMTQSIRDFSLPMDPVRFRIDPDEFQAPALLAPVVLKKAAALHREMGDIADLSADLDRALNLVGNIFTLLMPGTSGQRLRARLFTEGRDADPDADPPRLEADPPPVDLSRQALPALFWLLEQYGMRPTGPSSPSLNGLTDGQTDTLSGGISSTAGASPGVSATSN